MNDLAAEKKALRIEARRTRHQLRHMYGTEAAEKAAAHACRFLDGLPAGSNIALYWPLGDELDPRPLMRDLARLGHSCLLPVVVDKNLPLVFKPWDMGDPLIAGAFQVMEPSEDAPIISPDIIILPLLAFDDTGGRLGYGAGCYDRTLSEIPDIPAYGFAYSGQMVDDVPIGSFDRNLDAIITETGIVTPVVKSIVNLSKD